MRFSMSTRSFYFKLFKNLIKITYNFWNKLESETQHLELNFFYIKNLKM